MWGLNKIDQFSNYNQSKVKEQMKQLPEVSEIIKQTKLDLDRQHIEILSNITSSQLNTIIKTVCIDVNGSWKSTEQIKSHPSYVLLTQLCLDMMWYHSTKIDVDYGWWTKQWVSQFEQQYGMKVDGIADQEFFREMSNLTRWWKAPIKYNDRLTPANNLKIPYASKNISLNNMPQKTNSSSLLLKYQWYVREQCHRILWDKYRAVYPIIERGINDLVLIYKQPMNYVIIDRMLHLIYKENKIFSKSSRNYTPIGQIWRFAWIDSFVSSRGLNLWKSPRWSKSDFYHQVIATYGYMKLCGVFCAKTQKQLGIAYSKYNLWPYSSLSTKIKLFQGQAQEMKKYAKNHSRYEPDIRYAEFQYYASDRDKKQLA